MLGLFIASYCAVMGGISYLIIGSTDYDKMEKDSHSDYDDLLDEL